MTQRKPEGRDYYDILGADEYTSARDLDRLYKRKAAHFHPDKGGSEEAMKSLNEAYGVLRNETTRQAYDANRQQSASGSFMTIATPAARDIGVFGHFLTAFLCLMLGFFLMVLVRSQWIWFLWPLAILAMFVMLFGVLMARSALKYSAANFRNPLRGHATVQEVVFWTMVASSGYLLYLVLSAVG
jgi:curved DNA-binding protein CbpA